MGLFGSKKIYVSSSVYNLAGNEADRPNFLKSSLFSAVMNPHDAYLGETIVGNYLTGPGIMQRSFFNWAVRNDVAGLPTFTVRNTMSIDPEIVKPHIPLPGTPADLETRVQNAEITDGNFLYWAEDYILKNNPDANGTEWAADYNENTHQITIQYVGGATDTFSAGSFDKDKQFVIARYYQSVPSEVQPKETGPLTTDVLTTPSTSGYTLQSTGNTGVVNHTLNQTKTVKKEYSDGSPTTEETTYPSETVGYNGVERVYNRSDYVGGDGQSTETSSIEKWYHQFERRYIAYDETVTTQVNDMGGGETETVTTTVTGDHLFPIYDWREDTQETVHEAIVGGAQMWFYEIGTGIAALDALADEIPPEGVPEYYPFIPVRLNNKSILHDDYADLFAESSKAYKKATKGQSLEKLVEEVEDNPDLGDIDYSYVQWGVSVNVVERACKRYMYEFFRNLIQHQNTSASTITVLKTGIENYDAAMAELDAWKAAQGDQMDPLYNTPQPEVPAIGYPETSTVRLVADHPSLGGFDNRYSWATIEETNHTGLGKPDAEVGDIWFEEGEIVRWSVFSGIFRGGEGGGDSRVYNDHEMDQMFLYKQTGPNTYSRLSIWGAIHKNYIYGGKAVSTTLREGVADTSESVFIIPLHAPTVKSLGIKDFTQMAMSNTFLTFNCYKVVKKKWYQTFLGMILIVVAIVVVAALIAPGAVGAASGAFGTNAAVGASFGLTGTAAVVAGAVTNAIAAVVIAQAISTASVAIFGEKWGAIIGAIASFAVGFGISNGFGSLNITTMMNPQTLLKFSSALANGYAGFVQAEIGEINAEMEENQDVYDKAMRDLEDLMREQGLINDLLFDPLSLTDSVKGNGSSSSGSYVPETLDQFISRTTMTGSDVVDVTLSMVSEYSDLQLTLPKS
jgi:hypothetical protein